MCLLLLICWWCYCTVTIAAAATAAAVAADVDVGFRVVGRRLMIVVAVAVVVDDVAAVGFVVTPTYLLRKILQFLIPILLLLFWLLIIAI